MGSRVYDRQGAVLAGGCRDRSLYTACLTCHLEILIKDVKIKWVLCPEDRGEEMKKL